MEFLTPQVLALVPIVIGLVAVIKKVGLNTRYLPVVALILGMLGVVGLEGISATALIGGIVVGLSASGLYSGTKAVVK
jgi:hypothetical protein